MSDEQEYNKPYRLGVGIMLLNQDNMIFVGKRIDVASEAWQMPQGGIDEGEAPKDAALRELYEETGVVNVEIIAESNDWYQYDILLDMALELWNGQYIGQKQKWFLMRLEEGNIVNIDMPEPEFSHWKWVDVYDLPKLIVPFKVQLYTDLVREFAPLITSY